MKVLTYSLDYLGLRDSMFRILLVGGAIVAARAIYRSFNPFDKPIAEKSPHQIYVDALIDAISNPTLSFWGNNIVTHPDFKTGSCSDSNTNECLDLSNKGLTDEDVARIAQAISKNPLFALSVTEINLSNNLLTILPDLSICQRLATLDLRGNKIAMLSDILKYPMLKFLDLGFNRLSHNTIRWFIETNNAFRKASS
jgi:hypothetical protein